MRSDAASLVATAVAIDPTVDETSAEEVARYYADLYPDPTRTNCGALSVGLEIEAVSCLVR
jgi:hypothetical protein